MERYIDKTYYQKTYNGKVSEEKLDNLIIEASRYIQKHTFNRATSDIEAVKYCCCKIMDKINEYDDKKEKIKQQNNKKSETVGKMSVTYNDNKSSNDLNKELEIEIAEIIKLYLSDITDKNGVNLLYRGN